MHVHCPAILPEAIGLGGILGCTVGFAVNDEIGAGVGWVIGGTLAGGVFEYMHS